MIYRLISSSATFAIIQFPGKFNNHNVIWHANIQILSSINQTSKQQGIKQFIAITDHGNKLKSIVIGLNIQKITNPDILKTIIMISNYKNLKPGKHEFGEFFYY